jgi:hypothetical protein
MGSLIPGLFDAMLFAVVLFGAVSFDAMLFAVVLFDAVLFGAWVI